MIGDNYCGHRIALAGSRYIRSFTVESGKLFLPRDSNIYIYIHIYVYIIYMYHNTSSSFLNIDTHKIRLGYIVSIIIKP